MRETQNKRLWAYLLKYGKITAFEMFEKLHICHPPARIRDLREKYGYDTIPDRWIVKPSLVYDGEKAIKVKKRFKEYFLSEDKRCQLKTS